IANLDMYRKVPVDLLEGTRRGSILSTIAIFTMTTLFFLETKAYFSSTLATSLALDSNSDPNIRVNFNITMMDLKCDYATIDVVSVLGTQQNVTQHVQKFPIDQYGVRQRMKARNKNQHDVQLFDSTIQETIEELHADGEDAISLDETTLNVALQENTYVFVDFFANWCSHCRDLAPTWETLAEVMYEAAESRVQLPVMIGKIDCVDHGGLCQRMQIQAYPTLKFFVDGEEMGDYRGHRTVIEMAHFIAEMEKTHKGKGGVAQDATESEYSVLKNHPGCQISGFLLVDRAPGNFHIQAQSKGHDLAAHMTNVSHIINHLSFGKPFSKYFLKDGLKNTPPGFLETTKPFDGNVYITQNEHEAHHHYLKVITTEFEPEKGAQNSKYNKKEPSRAYQILQSSQLSLYRSDIVPEAKFTYDLSPIAVSYNKKYRHWYDYFTSLMAIIGGTFTVVGMLESGIH
ncbi:predicted protein, partial [Thalassiosira pseudonana CCMP1335]